MVRKMKVYSTSFMAFFYTAIFFYGADALVNVTRNGATFTTVVAAWPEVQDKSPLADVFRGFFYVVFLMFMQLLCGVYTTVITMTICLSHQYKNLQSYFHNLRRIFDENVSQRQKEAKYLDGFKLGVTLHAKTLWCRQEWQSICNILFSLQVILNVIVLILTLSQMAAFRIPMAMYHSGWHHCLSAPEIRKLVVCAMRQGQKPEVLWALGIVPMSYESYVSIVKSSYTIFSVLYSQN
ncbi:uncharacterized protein LOC106132479 [Amyelois transitella]|uniref:uncharacterized protein LOC106132479 n=1 Tax=Amyelois transitella TaxID=680683 RepID=UPI0029902580|nr:uncharacterized protein LOC106132479 [Amyelois transitella]